MKPYLSATQINMLAKCPKQYEFRYVDGIRSPPGVSLVLGKGGHKGVEANLRAKLASGELLSLEAVTQAAAEGVREEWEKEPVALTEEEEQLGANRVLGETVDKAVALVGLHHKVVAPAISPVAIESGFRLDLPGFPFDIIGYKDVEEETRIRDTKFKGKSPPEDAADTSIQLTLYHMESAARGKSVEVQLDNLVANKVPKYVPQKSKRSELDHRRFLRRVELAAQQIESGIFPPTDPTSWACSEKWCGYWDACEFGARQSVSLQVIDPKRLTSHLPDRAAPRIIEWGDAA
jgi:hypothetical protein